MNEKQYRPPNTIDSKRVEWTGKIKEIYMKKYDTILFFLLLLLIFPFLFSEQKQNALSDQPTAANHNIKKKQQ